MSSEVPVCNIASGCPNKAHYFCRMMKLRFFSCKAHRRNLPHLLKGPFDDVFSRIFVGRQDDADRYTDFVRRLYGVTILKYLIRNRCKVDMRRVKFVADLYVFVSGKVYLVNLKGLLPKYRQLGIEEIQSTVHIDKLPIDIKMYILNCLLYTSPSPRDS